MGLSRRMQWPLSLHVFAEHGTGTSALCIAWMGYLHVA